MSSSAEQPTGTINVPITTLETFQSSFHFDDPFSEASGKQPSFRKIAMKRETQGSMATLSTGASTVTSTSVAGLSFSDNSSASAGLDRSGRSKESKSSKLSKKSSKKEKKDGERKKPKKKKKSSKDTSPTRRSRHDDDGDMFDRSRSPPPHHQQQPVGTNQSFRSYEAPLTPGAQSFFAPDEAGFGDFSSGDDMPAWDADDGFGEPNTDVAKAALEEYNAQFTDGFEMQSRGSSEGRSSQSESQGTSIDLSGMEEAPSASNNVTTPNHDFYAARDPATGEINDSVSVLSDITGLTGAFNASTGFDFDEDDTDEPDVAPLSYPQMSQGAMDKFNELAAMAGQHRRGGNLSVRFSTVNIRYYQRTLGDNPSTLQGPPLGLGWKYRTTDPMDVNSFEQSREKDRRSNPSSLLLTPEERRARLQAVGVTNAEMASVIRQCVKIRNRRRQTIQNSVGLAKTIDEGLEGASSTFKRMLRFGGGGGTKNKI